MAEYKKRCNSLKLNFAVDCYDLSGSFVRRYRSIRDASDATGIAYCQIYACVMGKTKRARNYIWKKVDVDIAI